MLVTAQYRGEVRRIRILQPGDLQARVVVFCGLDCMRVGRTRCRPLIRRRYGRNCRFTFSAGRNHRACRMDWGDRGAFYPASGKALRSPKAPGNTAIAGSDQLVPNTQSRTRRRLCFLPVTDGTRVVYSIKRQHQAIVRRPQASSRKTCTTTRRAPRGDRIPGSV